MSSISSRWDCSILRCPNRHRMHVVAGNEADEIVHQVGDLLIRGPLEAGSGAVFADPHRAVAPRPQMAPRYVSVGGE